MPTISVFYGIIIRIFVEPNGKHHLPHIHAYYGEYEAAIDLNGKVIEGGLPRKKLRMVQVWIDIHKEDIAANWQLAVNGDEVIKIEPLK